jgi:hypothetical protein
LRFSKVVTQELSEAEKAKIEKFRKLLRTEKIVKDIITEEEKTVVEDGPVLRLYNEKLVAYLTAATNYNNKRIAAQAATGPEGKLAVADWTNNANLYRLQVKAAMDDWTGNGYRNEVDQMRAYINQVTQRDMMLWKQRLLEYFEDAEQAGLGADKPSSTQPWFLVISPPVGAGTNTTCITRQWIHLVMVNHLPGAAVQELISDYSAWVAVLAVLPLSSIPTLLSANSG